MLVACATDCDRKLPVACPRKSPSNLPVNISPRNSKIIARNTEISSHGGQRSHARRSIRHRPRHRRHLSYNIQHVADLSVHKEVLLAKETLSPYENTAQKASRCGQNVVGRMLQTKALMMMTVG